MLRREDLEPQGGWQISGSEVISQRIRGSVLIVVLSRRRTIAEHWRQVRAPVARPRICSGSGPSWLEPDGHRREMEPVQRIARRAQLGVGAANLGSATAPARPCSNLRLSITVLVL